MSFGGRAGRGMGMGMGLVLGGGEVMGEGREGFGTWARGMGKGGRRFWNGWDK